MKTIRYVCLLMSMLILLMGCSSTSSDASGTKIQISDLWNSQQNEFTLPGLSMSSTGDEIKSHYGVSELILYQSTATIEENGDKLIYATIPLGSSEIKAVVDFMWRDGAISMQNLIVNSAVDEKFGDKQSALVDELVKCYGDVTPDVDEYTEDDHDYVVEQYTWTKDGADSQLILFLTARDGQPFEIQLSCH